MAVSNLTYQLREGILGRELSDEEVELDRLERMLQDEGFFDSDRYLEGQVTDSDEARFHGGF